MPLCYAAAYSGGAAAADAAATYTTAAIAAAAAELLLLLLLRVGLGTSGQQASTALCSGWQQTLIGGGGGGGVMCVWQGAGSEGAFMGVHNCQLLGHGGTKQWVTFVIHGSSWKSFLTTPGSNPGCLVIFSSCSSIIDSIAVRRRFFLKKKLQLVQGEDNPLALSSSSLQLVTSCGAHSCSRQHACTTVLSQVCICLHTLG